MADKTIEIYLQEFADGRFGYGLRLLDESATLGDYVQALNDWQSRTMADCRGCDACCYERIPLTIADFALARPLIARRLNKTEAAVSLRDWLEQVAEGRQHADGALDITLKRQADGACGFLDQERAECREHLYRSLVCQTHCCLPKTLLADELRAAIINAGEDELCRRLLQLPDRAELLPPGADCRAEDYPRSGFAAIEPENWQNLRLSAILEPEIWQRLHKSQRKCEKNATTCE